MTKAPIALAAAAGGAVAAAKAFTWWRGDSRMVWMSEQLADVERLAGGGLTGTITIQNQGRALGVVRKVEGHVVSGGTGAVLATLQGSRPPERGWWVSNILRPDGSCVAEVDLLLEAEPTGPVVIELSIQEMGRRVFQYRTARVTVPIPDRVGAP